MKKIIGTKAQYYDQTNNGQVELFKDYFGKKKFIACGPETAAAGWDIAGWPMDVFTPGEQPGDAILMVAHNPKNLALFEERRDLDYDKYPPNEVPQIYEVMGHLIFGSAKTCRFLWDLNYNLIRNNIINDRPVMICGEFPSGGHYVLAVGFDDEKRVIIYNDPFPVQWPDNNGYNRIMDLDFLAKMHKWRIEFYSPV